MGRGQVRIPFAEFESNPGTVFDRVVGNNEVVVVEKENGAGAVLRAIPARKAARRRGITDADWDAFLASAGSWDDVDTEKMKRDIRESRRISSRPRVEL